MIVGPTTAVVDAVESLGAGVDGDGCDAMGDAEVGAVAAAGGSMCGGDYGIVVVDAQAGVVDASWSCSVVLASCIFINIEIWSLINQNVILVFNCRLEFCIIDF